MSKVTIDYDELNDPEVRKHCAEIADDVRGATLGHRPAFRWRMEPDNRGRPFVVLADHQRAANGIRRWDRASFLRMTGEQVAKKIHEDSLEADMRRQSLRE